MAGVLTIVFLGANLGKEYYRERQIKKEIDSLKNEIKSLEENNYSLSRLVELSKTNEYAEMEIRKRFNLGKEGEKMAVIIEPDSADSEQNKNNGGSGDKNPPNYLKWWNYFFASK